MKKLFVLYLLSLACALAAVPATAVWDVRSTGASTNAGCFVPGLGGTDFSQQDAPQYSFTDLVVDGTLNTKVTSASHSFIAADVGNCIAISAGTGWTAGIYSIASVSSGAATLDTSPGAVTTSGGIWKEGGAFALPTSLPGKYVAGNSIYIKSGTYTLNAGAAAFATAGTAALPVLVEGYGTTHGDAGTRPIITSSTSAQDLFTVNAASYFHFRNLSFTHTGSPTRGTAIHGVTTSGTLLRISQCVFDGVLSAYDGGSRDYAGFAFARNTVKNTTNTSGAVIRSDSALSVVTGNVFYNNAGAGYDTGGNTTAAVFVGNLFAKNLWGFHDAAGARAQTIMFIGNTFATQTSNDAIFSSASTSVQLGLQNNLFYGITAGRAVNITVDTIAGTRASFNSYNAYGNNLTANQNWPAGIGDQTLTADPFTSSAGTDWSINGSAGGGALVKGNGWPGSWPGITGVGHLDIGAVQSSGGSGGQRAYTFVQ